MKKSFSNLFLLLLLSVFYSANAQNFVGTYSGEDGGTIKIIDISEKNIVKFSFGFYSQTRIREYEGFATFISDTVAICKESDNCIITLSFGEHNRIKVKASQQCEDDTFLYMSDSYIKKSEVSQESSWSGYYKNKRNGLELSILMSESGDIEYVFFSASDCEKIFDQGTAKVYKEANTALFVVDYTPCNISFVFDGIGISIKGTNCDHGLFCIGFDGYYAKNEYNSVDNQ